MKGTKGPFSLCVFQMSKFANSACCELVEHAPRTGNCLLAASLLNNKSEAVGTTLALRRYYKVSQHDIVNYCTHIK